MKLKPINSKEKKKILKILKEQFGFEKELDYAFFISEKNRIYIINNEIKEFDYNQLNASTLGLYIGEVYSEEIRLSIEGSQLIGPGATKNIIEVTKDEAWNWMKGEELSEKEIDTKKYIIIKHKTDFMGCGKKRGDRIMNYISKTRRVNASEPF